MCICRGWIGIGLEILGHNAWLNRMANQHTGFGGKNSSSSAPGIIPLRYIIGIASCPLGEAVRVSQGFMQHFWFSRALGLLQDLGALCISLLPTWKWDLRSPLWVLAVSTYRKWPRTPTNPVSHQSSRSSCRKSPISTKVFTVQFWGQHRPHTWRTLSPERLSSLQTPATSSRAPRLLCF